jgi:branched-subunit amino acid transport protein
LSQIAQTARILLIFAPFVINVALQIGDLLVEHRRADWQARISVWPIALGRHPLPNKLAN